MKTQASSAVYLAAHFFVRCLIPCCAAAAVLLLTGCTKQVSFVGVSHYSYPVDFYCDDGGAGRFVLLASNIAPGSLFGANIRHIPDGSVYRFSVRSLQGDVISRIVMPSKTFNDANAKDNWQLVLKPPSARPYKLPLR